MRCFLKRLALCLLASAGLAGSVRADEAGVLLWMVDNPDICRNGEKIAPLSGFTSADGYQATAARVVATAKGEDGATICLNLCYENELGEFVDIGLKSVGLWDGYKAGPIYASLSGLSVESYTYAIELGTTVDGSWYTLAVSNPHVYSDIEQFTDASGFAGSLNVPWQPTIYNVPEPTGGLLVLMGLAMLSLRRKEVRT